MKEKKFKTFFLVSSVMLLLVGILFLLLSMTEPSSRWRLYHDDRWEFSLEFPVEWSQAVMVENYGKPDHVIKRMITFKSPEGTTICLNIFSEDNSREIMEWFEDNYMHMVSKEGYFPDAPDTTVNGAPAINVDNPQNSACDLKLTFVKIGSMIFEFQYKGSDGFASMDVYGHMLSSFSCTGGYGNEN